MILIKPKINPAVAMPFSSGSFMIKAPKITTKIAKISQKKPKIPNTKANVPFPIIFHFSNDIIFNSLERLNISFFYDLNFLEPLKTKRKRYY